METEVLGVKPPMITIATKIKICDFRLIRQDQPG